MWLLKDAEEEVGNIMRDREILCVVYLSLFFFLSYTLLFVQSHPVDKSVQLQDSKAEQAISESRCS